MALGGLVSGLDSIFVWLNTVLKQNLADYSDLETAQDEYNLVAKDGSLLSLIKIDGYRTLIDKNSFYDKIAEPFSRGLDPFFEKSGYMMQIWFSLDPDKSERVVEEALRPSYETANRLQLDLVDLLDERKRNIAKNTNYEECYLVLWTRPSQLTKNEAKLEREDKKKIYKEQKVPLQNVQDIFRGNGMLQNRHNSFVNQIENLLHSLGIAAEKYSVRDAVRAIRQSIDDDFTPNNWQAALPGDRMTPTIRKDNVKYEEYDIIHPKLSWQICPRDAKIVNDKLVQVGDKVFAPGYVDLWPKDVDQFVELFNSINGNYPWRFSVTLEGDGLSAVSMRGTLAAVMGVVSGDNKLLNRSVRTLRELSTEYNETIVKTRIAFCTWGDKSNPALVERHLSELARAIQGWGLCLVSEVTGDPVAGMMSSALGATYNSVATVSGTPLTAVSTITPFARPSSPWNRGAVLLVSPDQKLMPYQPGSSVQSTWISLIFAKPGAGKSVFMNLTNLALCLAPGITRLPRIGIIDIGPSSSGLISLLKEALPLSQKHLVHYARIRMTDEYSINAFDTQLGCRYPSAEEKGFLENYVSLLVTDPGVELPEKGIAGLISAVIDDMYYKTSDNGQPKRYDRGVEPIVDKKLDEIRMKTNPKTTWWEIVDALFLKEHYHEAGLAQRYAVPVLSDATTSAVEEKIADVYGDVIVSTQESLVKYFTRSITDVLNQYKILGKPTVFDLGDARIVSLDLDEVAKGGGVQAEKQTAIMYMLARYVLGKDFKLALEGIIDMPYPQNKDIPEGVPVKEYKEYHRKRVEESKEDFKRLCLDEFHRTSHSQQIRDQIVTDMREGRKWNLDVTLVSQSLEDFSDDMRSFATGVFIMSKGNEQDTDNLLKVFGTSDPAEKLYLQKGLRAPHAGRPGIFMAKFETKSGTYTQRLSAPLGAEEFWAFTTTSEDVVVRNRLYKQIGPAPTRKLLAQTYPGGVKDLVEQRKNLLKDSGYDTTMQESNVYTQLVSELLEVYEKIR